MSQNFFESSRNITHFSLNPGVDEARKQLGRGRWSELQEATLSSEDVLVYLYEKIFPQRAGLPEKIRGADVSQEL